MSARVLLLDHAPIFGGAEAFLLDVLRNLDRKRYQPHITIDSSSPVVRQLQVVANETQTPFYLTSLPRLNQNPLFIWKLWRSGRQLAMLLRSQKINILHTFTARTHLIGAVATKLSGVPLVWRICDDTLPPWLLQRFAFAPREIVSASHWLTTQYPRLRFTDLVPDGAYSPQTFTQAEARTRLGLPQDGLYIAHVGRLVRWKGQTVLLKALAQLPNVNGLIVGGWHSEDEIPGPLGGGKTYYDELCQLSQSFKERVYFTGFLSQPALAYAAADIVVHTSTLPEPFGRVVIEAMFAERPVVATNAGALSEIVEDGVSGFLTPMGDSEALAITLQKLLADTNLRRQIALVGKKSASEKFSLASTLNRLCAVYDRVLGRGEEHL